MAKKKTKALNRISSTSAPPPMKRACVTVEDIQDQDDIMSAPSNPSNTDLMNKQESTSGASHAAAARHLNAKVHAL